MASTKGAYLKNIRYDSTTPQRIEKYIERESWNKKQWHEWVDSKLNETLYNAREYVPFYQKYWSECEKSYEELKNWPIITKQKINEFPDLFIDARFKKSQLYHDHTSGTTGTPLDIYLDYDSVKEQYALFEARVKQKYNIELDEPWAIIGAQRVTDVNRKTPPFWVYNYASCQLYLSSLHIAKWSVTDYVNALVKYQPKYLVGYTNSIFELAREMLDENLKFPLKAIITNGEPVNSIQKNIIESVFHCPVIETYGQAELVSFANTFPNGKMYLSPEMGNIEFGQKQKIDGINFAKLISTGFLNKAMPLIRYDTNDLVQDTIKHINGYLPEIGKVLGRNDDVLTLSDGRKIVQIDGIFTSDLKIRYGQIIQEDFDSFTINIVLENNWNDYYKSKLISALKERLGEVKININIMSSFEKTWAGKFRVITSRINS
jgi:phenylacetate-CoA ligase